MSAHPITTLYLHKELVDERIRGLRQEAAEHALARRVSSVSKARRQVERASRRLQDALSRV